MGHVHVHPYEGCMCMCILGERGDSAPATHHTAPVSELALLRL